MKVKGHNGRASDLTTSSCPQSLAFLGADERSPNEWVGWDFTKLYVPVLITRGS